MWTCPICGDSGNTAQSCRQCRFDLSADAASFPTLCPLPESAAALRRLARERWRTVNSSYSVKKDRIVDSVTRTGPEPAKKVFTVPAGDYAIPGSRIVENQFHTGEDPGPDPPPEHGTEYAVSGSSVVDGQYWTVAPDFDRSDDKAPPESAGNAGQPEAKKPDRESADRAESPFARAGQIGPEPPARAAEPIVPVVPVQPVQKREGPHGVRRVLGWIMVVLAFVCGVGLLSEGSGTTAPADTTAMIAFIVFAWLLLRKRPPKE